MLPIKLVIIHGKLFLELYANLKKKLLNSDVKGWSSSEKEPFLDCQDIFWSD